MIANVALLHLDLLYAKTLFCPAQQTTSIKAQFYTPFSASIVCSLCLADSIAIRSSPCTFMSSATIEPPPASGRSGVGSVPFGRGAAESSCCDRGRSMSAVSSVWRGGNGAEVLDDVRPGKVAGLVPRQAPLRHSFLPA